MTHKKLILFVSPGVRDNEIFRLRNFYSNLESNMMFVQLKQHLESQNYTVATADKYDLAQADHIVFADAPVNDPYLKEIRRRRKELKARISLIMLEAPVINYYQYTKQALKIFDRVLTWNPTLVDHKKFFPYRWPEQFYPINPFNTSFEEKKFICMTNSNKFSLYETELYSERKKAVLFFEKTPEGIDIYGRGWNKRPPLRGAVFHAGMRWKFSLKKIATLNLRPLIQFSQYVFNTKKLDPKSLKGTAAESSVEVYSRYRFVLAFENARDIPGYSTEKMFNCFNARSIPIYWGDKELLKHVPASCYIDMNKFKNYQELYDYLKSIDKEQYNQYITNIENYLKTANDGPYSINAFVQAFDDGVIKS